jgi:hypothetical protein
MLKSQLIFYNFRCFFVANIFILVMKQLYTPLNGSVLFFFFALSMKFEPLGIRSNYWLNNSEFIILVHF